MSWKARKSFVTSVDLSTITVTLHIHHKTLTDITGQITALLFVMIFFYYGPTSTVLNNYHQISVIREQNTHKNTRYVIRNTQYRDPYRDLSFFIHIITGNSTITKSYYTSKSSIISSNIYQHLLIYSTSSLNAVAMFLKVLLKTKMKFGSAPL